MQSMRIYVSAQFDQVGTLIRRRKSHVERVTHKDSPVRDLKKTQFYVHILCLYTILLLHIE